MWRRGSLFVLSSPSGAGKTSHAKRLLGLDPFLCSSVSVTTRRPREGEVEGVDYFFVDDATFDTMVQDGDFLEWAHVFSHRYGTPKTAVLHALDSGKDVLFDIDWQGAEKIASLMRDQMVSVFLLPPSLRILEERLLKRDQDLDFVARRMEQARSEISHARDYDYVVVNQDFDECANVLSSIVNAARHRKVTTGAFSLFPDIFST